MQTEVKEINKFYYRKNQAVNNEKNITRKCENCTVEVQNASYAKHFRSKKQMQNERSNDKITPYWLVHDTIGNEKNMYIFLNH